MINYTPKPDTGKAIFDVMITFKDGSLKGIRSKNYRYDICKPDTTRKVHEDVFTICPILFENERVEGLGLSVTVELGNYLTINDQDTQEFWVFDYTEVRDICTRTCKQVLPEEGKDNG